MGTLGYNIDELLDLTPRQFFNALQGLAEYQQNTIEGLRNLIFSAIRFNASSISAGLSGDLSKQINRMRFDWEKKEERSERLTYGEMVSMFDNELGKA